MLLRRAALLLAVLACGCPGPLPVKPPRPDAGPCVDHAAGDASAALEAQPVGIDPSGNLKVLADGDALGLAVPGQGGYVLYAGVRARNLQACGVTMSAQLVDGTTGQSLTGLDQRQSDLTTPSGDYFLPANDELLFALPNIPACPDPLGKGVQGKSIVLQVTVTDRTRSKAATVRVNVVPTCPQSLQANCQCVCGPNYQAGSCP